MAHILGAGMTRFGKRDEALVDLLVEAADAALDAAGYPEVDRLVVGVQAPVQFTGDANFATCMATELGLYGVPATRVETGPSTGTSALEAAAHAVDAGASRSALVVCGERMTPLGSRGAGEVLQRMVHPLERSYGFTMPSLAALQARAAMRSFGWTREDLTAASVKAHRHGALSPYAHFRKEVAAEDVEGSPLVAPPLHVYDCAPVSDGAAALVVADDGPVRVAGVGHATDLLGYTDRRYPGWLTHFAATATAADRAFNAARLSHDDVDVVETHDAFTHLELQNLVDLGFYTPDEARDALHAGDTSLGGDLPVNVGGGLKARGHPVGATGAAQVTEAWWQLMGRAERRQVDGARVALTHNIGGFGNNVLVTLLEAAE